MTARQRALAKPESVRVVLKMYCTRRALNGPIPTPAIWAELMEQALDWWDRMLAEAIKDGLEETEEQLAAATVEKARKSPGAWGKILRVDAN